MSFFALFFHTMELLIWSKELNDLIESSSGQSFSDQEIETIKRKTEFGEFDQVSFSPVNIGPGADFWTVLATIVLVNESFLLVPSALEGMKQWKSLVEIIQRLIAKQELVAIDEEGAQMLAIDYMRNHYSYKYLQIKDSHVVKLHNISNVVRPVSPLASIPYAYYILTIQTDDLKTFILGVKSNGEINVIKAFDYNPYGMTESNG